MASNKDTWLPAEIAELRRMDAAGIRISFMAAALGRSKSAVYRKRKALQLQRWRESPIKPAKVLPPRPIGRGRTLPVLLSLRGEVL